MWLPRGHTASSCYSCILWYPKFTSINVCISHLNQFSRSVGSDSLWPHGLQHARPPCPSPTPRAYSNSCPLSRWCHPTISSSVDPFSSCLQSFPASVSFQMSQLFASGGQSIGVSASASLPPINRWVESKTWHINTMENDGLRKEGNPVTCYHLSESWGDYV